MAMRCRLCGKGATEIRGYLKRMNELGVEGVWECRPSCEADLSDSERVVAAIEDDSKEDLMAHTCHAVACERSVPPQMLMCRQHWFMVPPKLRSQVWATYQDGQCDTFDPTSAYCQAAKAAVIAVAEKEGRKIDPKNSKILLYDMLQTSDGDSNE